MVNLEGKTIIFLGDVTAPASQSGGIGETKTVGTDISNFAANFLLRGNRIRVIEPSQAHAVRVELGLEKPKTERSPSDRRTNSQTNQRRDPRPKETSAAGGGS